MAAQWTIQMVDVRAASPEAVAGPARSCIDAFGMPPSTLIFVDDPGRVAFLFVGERLPQVSSRI
jgi:hypothetical protein